MALIDDGFAYLYPEAKEAFSKKVASITMLPPSGASTELYAALDEEQPNTIYLSPLLSGDIPTILSRNDTTRIAYMGTATLRQDPRLFVAHFSSSDAATMAARFMATRRETQTKPQETLSAAVFTGNDADTIAKTFLQAYREAGGQGEPIIKTSYEPYSQAIADELRSMDIVEAYIACPPSETARWLAQGFDPYAYILVEYALPDVHETTMASGAAAWDIEATLGSLSKIVSNGMAGQIPGTWKIIEYRRKGGVKRQ